MVSKIQSFLAIYFFESRVLNFGENIILSNLLIWIFFIFFDNKLKMPGKKYKTLFHNTYF